jgi:hypothetical protein
MKRARIPKKNVKLSDTSLETDLDDLGKEYDIPFTRAPTIFVKELDGTPYGFRPDRAIAGTNILVEADGPYHESVIQRRKSAWRDAQLIASRFRVLHISGRLIQAENRGDLKAYWKYIAGEVNRFRAETTTIYYIPV